MAGLLSRPSLAAEADILSTCTPRLMQWCIPSWVPLTSCAALTKPGCSSVEGGSVFGMQNKSVCAGHTLKSPAETIPVAKLFPQSLQYKPKAVISCLVLDDPHSGAGLISQCIWGFSTLEL